jgi:hypothetical protein
MILSMILWRELMRRFIEEADRGQSTLLPECDEPRLHLQAVRAAGYLNLPSHSPAQANLRLEVGGYRRHRLWLA